LSWLPSFLDLSSDLPLETSHFLRGSLSYLERMWRHRQFFLRAGSIDEWMYR
jgi:hypothetical protein